MTMLIVLATAFDGFVSILIKPKDNKPLNFYCPVSKIKLRVMQN